VLAFATDFRRLILAFHKFNSIGCALPLNSVLTERGRLAMKRPVSRRGWDGQCPNLNPALNPNPGWIDYDYDYESGLGHCLGR
jgi:hypothetical protein